MDCQVGCRSSLVQAASQEEESGGFTTTAPKLLRKAGMFLYYDCIVAAGQPIEGMRTPPART
jgi:hypothetical protein